ncbi:MAG: hypothetical protein M3Y07_07530 [Acidobacteriota bacterium]|nr:hypothetical protein [Acidobacteriota bacterium]
MRKAAMILMCLGAAAFAQGPSSEQKSKTDNGTRHHTRRHGRNRSDKKSNTTPGANATTVPMNPTDPTNPDPMRSKRLPIPPRTPGDRTNPVRPADPTSPTVVKP